MLLFSGPAISGKGTLIQATQQSIFEATLGGRNFLPKNISWKDASCKTHLYKLVQDFFLISEERFWEIYENRALKEKPLPEFRITLNPTEFKALEKLVGSLTIEGCNLYCKDFGGDITINLSSRVSMIYLSEIVLKPRMGFNFFGRARMHLIKNSSADIFYDDSSSCFNGDSSELDGLVEHFGEDNILLINILGRGTYSGDSRGYHPKGTVKHTHELWNTVTEQEFLEEGYKVITQFLDTP